MQSTLDFAKSYLICYIQGGPKVILKSILSITFKMIIQFLLKLADMFGITYNLVCDSTKLNFLKLVNKIS